MAPGPLHRRERHLPAILPPLPQEFPLLPPLVVLQYQRQLRPNNVYPPLTKRTEMPGWPYA